MDARGVDEIGRDQAFGRTVLVRELSLLIVARAVAPFVHGLAEEPGGPVCFIERPVATSILVAAIVLIVWLVGFVFRAGEGRRWYRW